MNSKYEALESNKLNYGIMILIDWLAISMKFRIFTLEEK